MRNLKTFLKGLLVMTVLSLIAGSLYHLGKEVFMIISGTIALFFVCFAAGMIWEER